jgi:hypothetical protein
MVFSISKVLSRSLRDYRPEEGLRQIMLKLKILVPEKSVVKAKKDICLLSPHVCSNDIKVSVHHIDGSMQC